MRELFGERIFIFVMWWRIVYGFLRMILGFSILKVVGKPIIDVVATLLHHELIEDPNDGMFLLIREFFGRHPFEITYFLAFYFIFWGIIDIFLSHNLIRHKLWAFPISLTLIGLFVFYEFFRFTHTHSLILLSVMFVDFIILWIISDEYKKLETEKVV